MLLLSHQITSPPPPPLFSSFLLQAMEEKNQEKLVRIPLKKGQIEGRMLKALINAVVAVNRMAGHKDGWKQEVMPNARFPQTITSA